MSLQCAWTQGSDTVRVDYTVTSRWATGFNGELSISNNASRAIADWRLSFQLQPQITRIWNGSIISHKGTEYVIGPASWDEGELASGEQLKIGFVAQGAAIALPTAAYLNGTPLRFNEASPAPLSKPASVVPAPAWPRTTFSPYVDATAWPPLDLLTVAKTLEVHHFRLGFVVAQSATQPNPSWGGAHSATSAYRLREINSLRLLGGDVAIALGGAVGTELAVATHSAAELAAKYKSVVDAYSPRVLDFDLEGVSLTDRQSIQRRAEALSLLIKWMATEQRPLEIWFTLPVLPAGLSADGLEVLRTAIERGVSISGVNGMAMDYGNAIAQNPAGRLGVYAIEAARSLHRQLRALYAANGAPKTDSEAWSMVGITPMIGRNDVAAEIFEPGDARQLVEFAMKSGLGLVAMWSLNRDRACEQPQPLASPTCSGIQQSVHEFAHIFKVVGASR